MTAAATLDYRPFGAETWRNPFDLYRRLRDEDPLHRSSLGLWVLSRFDDVARAARSTDRFSSAQGLTFRNEKDALALAPTIVMMDPPDHTRYRRLASRLFTPRRVAALERSVRHEVDARLARLAESGGDFVDGLARPLPAFVVAHFLGVPGPDRSRFEAWTGALVQAQAHGSNERAGDALAELYEYVSGLIERRRRDPGEDLISVLLAADADGRGIGVDGVLGYAFVMIAGGNDTTTGLLGGAAEILTEHPEQRRRLAEGSVSAAQAVEEILRLTSPVQGLCRVATADVTMHGRTIAAGDRVLLCYGAANRDPREFGPDADEVDLGRQFERHLAFSSGSHHCLGAAAARLQGRVLVDALAHTHGALEVDGAAAEFAAGAFTRRHERLPVR